MNRDEDLTDIERRACELMKNKSRMEQDEITADLERQAGSSGKL